MLGDLEWRDALAETGVGERAERAERLEGAPRETKVELKQSNQREKKTVLWTRSLIHEARGFEEE